VWYWGFYLMFVGIMLAVLKVDFQVKGLANSIRGTHSTAHNAQSIPYANCSPCYWCGKCNVKFGGQVCRCKVEPRTGICSSIVAGAQRSKP